MSHKKDFSYVLGSNWYDYFMPEKIAGQRKLWITNNSLTTQKNSTRCGKKEGLENQ